MISSPAIGGVLAYAKKKLIVWRKLKNSSLGLF